MTDSVFLRHTTFDPPFVSLAEPIPPSSDLQAKLESLGFEIAPSDGLWWCPLRNLGRKNMSIAAIGALLGEHGIAAQVMEWGEYHFAAEDADEEEEEEEEEEDANSDAVRRDLQLLEGDFYEVADIVDEVVPFVSTLARQVRDLQAQVQTLHGMLSQAAGSSGVAGRSILVQDPGPLHIIDGRSVFIDPVRNVPVLATPEERVRQCVTRHLVDHLHFPLHLIESEFRLPRSADRADLVIRVEGEHSRYFAVIECKEPGVPLNDDVRDQAERYARKLGAAYFGITNGQELKTWRVDGDDRRPVDAFPNLQMLLGQIRPAELVSPPASIDRPDFDEMGGIFVRERLSEEGALSASGPAIVVNFASLFFDTRESPEGLEADGWHCITDRKLVNTSFGNAGFTSHAYSGLYRSLLLEHPKDGKALAFFRTWRTGATRAYPMLALGLHHVEEGRRHHAVQLNLERGLEVDEEGAMLVHDGRMAKGGGGGFKRAEVIAQVAREAPDLIEGGRALLGRLPTDRLITWEDAFPALVRLLRFARAADVLRTR